MCTISAGAGGKARSSWLTSHGSTPPDASRLQIPAAGGRPRSNSARSQNGARRPGVGARQPCIGIRRMPSNQALRQVAVDQNASTTQLGRTQSGLQVLDETCALGQVPSNKSNGAASSDTQQEQPGRLRRASIALQSALGFKKDSGKDKEGQIGGTATEPERLADEQGRQFNDNMVDVLDTLGMLSCSKIVYRMLMLCHRSRNRNTHLPHQRSELSLHSQSW